MLGSVTVKAGDRSYQIAFTTSAMVAYEKEFDEPFLKIVERFDADEIANLRFTLLVSLFGFALRAKNRNLSDDEVAEIIDEVSPKEIITAIGEAISAAFPQGEESGKKTDPAPVKRAQRAK